jgi:hypothetical protein
MLMLAVQQVAYGNNSNHQQRMAVVQHVSFLFSRLVTSAGGLFGDRSGAEAAKACVRQVLAAAVHGGNAQVLQELMGVNAAWGCSQLLTY